MSKLGEKILLMFAPKNSMDAFGEPGLDLPVAPDLIKKLQAERKIGGRRQTDEAAFAGFTDVFPNFQEAIRGKDVLDYGCGGGDQTVALARYGANYAVGLDIMEHSYSQNAEMVAKEGLSVAFKSKITEEERGRFDIVISMNAFEHFHDPDAELDRMIGLLKPGGLLYIAFGPLWYAPWGVHNMFFVRIPWANILFSDQSILRARRRFIDLHVESFDEIGINKMTVKRFERLVASRNLRSVYFKHLTVFNMDFMHRIPVLRELFVNGIVCVLGRD